MNFLILYWLFPPEEKFYSPPNSCSYRIGGNSGILKLEPYFGSFDFGAGVGFDTFLGTVRDFLPRPALAGLLDSDGPLNGFFLLSG